MPKITKGAKKKKTKVDEAEDANDVGETSGAVEPGGKKSKKRKAVDEAEESNTGVEPAAVEQGGKKTKKRKIADQAEESNNDIESGAALEQVGKKKKKKTKIEVDAEAVDEDTEAANIVEKKKKKLATAMDDNFASPNAPKKKKGKNDDLNSVQEMAARIASRPVKGSKGQSSTSASSTSKLQAAPEKPTKTEEEVENKEPLEVDKPFLEVFVDGVPYNWTIDKIKEFFESKCGSVDSVRAPTWQDTGRLRGFAHVSFLDPSSWNSALALDGTLVGSNKRYLKIEKAKPPERRKTAADIPKGCTRLFVKNLPYDATEDEIATIFERCGPVKEVRIVTRNSPSGPVSKGFCYIEFAGGKALRKAMEQDFSLRNRSLKLDADAGQGPKAGFHYRKEAYDSGYGPEKTSKGKGKGKKESLF